MNTQGGGSWDDHKYVAKVGEPPNTRYFYSAAEYQAYMNGPNPTSNSANTAGSNSNSTKTNTENSVSGAIQNVSSTIKSAVSKPVSNVNSYISSAKETVKEVGTFIQNLANTSLTSGLDLNKSDSSVPNYSARTTTSSTKKVTSTGTSDSPVKEETAETVASSSKASSKSSSKSKGKSSSKSKGKSSSKSKGKSSKSSRGNKRDDTQKFKSDDSSKKIYTEALSYLENIPVKTMSIKQLSSNDAVTQALLSAGVESSAASLEELLKYAKKKK